MSNDLILNSSKDIIDNFFDYLENYMESRCLNQAEFCREFNISYKWFNNTMRIRPDNLGMEVLCKIAKKLDISIIDMFTYHKKKI